MPAERPIPFSGPMVRAILDGRKTQTRRLIRKPNRLEGLMLAGEEGEWCPYGQPGDLLWVREAWSVHSAFDSEAPRDLVGTEVVKYAADGGRWESARTRNPFHLPKRFARLWLELLEVRVERVQEINEEDARAEGVREFRDLLLSPRGADAWCKYTVRAAEAQGRSRPRTSDSVGAFAYLWDRLNKKRAPWSSSPWVWVLTFRRTEAPKGAA